MPADTEPGETGDPPVDAPNTITRNRREYPPHDRLASAPANDDRLSWAAKGLYWYLLSRPPRWRVYVSQLASVGTNGRDATRSALKELIQWGYVRRERARGTDGRLAGYRYEILDQYEGDVPVPLETPAAATSHDAINGLPEDGSTVNGPTVDGQPPTSHNGDTGITYSNQHTHTRARGGEMLPDLDADRHVDNVVGFFVANGSTGDAARRFHALHASTGWTVAGRGILDWRPLAARWIADDRKRPARSTASSSTSSPTAPPAVLTSTPEYQPAPMQEPAARRPEVVTAAYDAFMATATPAPVGRPRRSARDYPTEPVPDPLPPTADDQPVDGDQPTERRATGT